MALIHRGALDDLPEKSAGRAALSSMVLVDIVGGRARDCCGGGWLGGAGGAIEG